MKITLSERIRLLSIVPAQKLKFKKSEVKKYELSSQSFAGQTEIMWNELGDLAEFLIDPTEFVRELLKFY